MKTFPFFDLPAGLPGPDEHVETLAESEGFRVERIISHGHQSAPDHWYDQPADEWVMLVQGEAVLEWEDGQKTRLVAGDALLIPARRRHRVQHTSQAPPCLWLAVHARAR